MSTQPRSLGVPFDALSLDYPMSVGIFDKYADAQRAVDTLSDKEFPVQNCLIVGTQLRQLERVTGRLTWSRVLLGGALSGIWFGLFVGLIFALFDAGNNPLALVGSTMAYGAIFGMGWVAAGYAMARGRRDFTSVSQIVPGRFEVLVEHKFAQQAREILAGAGIGSTVAAVPGGAGPGAPEGTDAP
jgi:hypothetical protein